MERTKRLEALAKLKNETTAPVIIKQAGVVDLLKDAFTSISQSVASSFDKSSPVTSVLQYFAIAMIARRSVLLSALFAAISLFFGVNVGSVFESIKQHLTPHLQSPEAIENLNKNQDSIVRDIATKSVDPEVKHSDEQIQSAVKSVESSDGADLGSILGAFSHHEYYGLVKQGAAPISPNMVKKILPIIQFFGPGRLGIAGIFFWIIKAILIGAGITAATGVLGGMLGHKPVTPETSEVATETTEKEESKPLPQSNQVAPSDKSPQIASKLKSKNNTALESPVPNSGGAEWVLSAKVDNHSQAVDAFAKQLFDDVFRAYTGFENAQIPSSKVMQAAKATVTEFMQKTNFKFNQDDNVQELRIPGKFTTRMQIINHILGKMQ